MKKFFKRFLFSLGIVFAVGVLSSCTKSFCNVQDQAEMISIYAKNNIESIRKFKKISQQELADALEVTRQTISSLENGRYNPSILLAFKIAKFFNMSIEEIFIYEGD